MGPMRKCRLSQQTGPLDRTFCLQIDRLDGGESMWCEPQDGGLFSPPPARDHRFGPGAVPPKS